MAEDKINHPSHYTALSVEPIALARHCDFCSGNVLKYILRSPFKGSMLDDLKKALWYLRYLQNHPHLYHTIDRWSWSRRNLKSNQAFCVRIWGGSFVRYR